jgi:hypothetical protein
VLGAVRFLDAVTGLRILDPLVVSAPGVRWLRNRLGYYVIADAPGLARATESFGEQPADVPVGSVPIALTVRDPGGRYLPRRGTLRLPRDPDPSRADEPESLFRPVDVRLFPAPAAGTAPGWALIRATVFAGQTDRGLPGALVRVLRQRDGRHLASGLSDRRGEALVAVPGIPVTTWEEGEGPVLATQVEVTLKAHFDPNAADPPDPDDLEARHLGLSASGDVNRSLASGQTLVATLAVTLP